MRPGSPSRRLLVLAILGAIALFALMPAAAGARITNPPGATEGDQYFEEVPNGGGSSSIDRGGADGSAPVAGAAALSALGPDGQAAADLAQSNRPPEQGQQNRGSQSQTQPSSSQGEAGMGTFFPILLVVTVIAAIAYGLRRRLTPA